MTGAKVAKIKLRYVDEYIDRTGKLRRYFRKGGKRIGPLNGEPGSAEFMTAYAAYLAEKPAAAKTVLHADSLGKLIFDFYGSRLFTRSEAVQPEALQIRAGAGREGARA
jgi:hypothetical protein